MKQKLVHSENKTVVAVQCSQDSTDLYLSINTNGTKKEGQLLRSRLCCPFTSEGDTSLL